PPRPRGGAAPPAGPPPPSNLAKKRSPQTCRSHGRRPPICMPAREKTSATFLAAAVAGGAAVEGLGEAEFGGFAVGCSAGPRYKLVRGELMRRSSRFVNDTASAAQTTSPLPHEAGDRPA